MKKKLKTKFSVQMNTREDRWMIADTFDTFEEAKAKALECNTEWNVRIVRLDRTLIEEYPSRGLKSKSVSIYLTSNGPKAVTNYKPKETL